MLTSLKLKFIFVAAAAALTLAACGGGGGGGGATPAAPAAVTTIQGKVLDAAGQPIVGASVSAGAVQTASGADGSFELKPSGTAASTIVLLKKAGFATTAKEVPVAAGKTVNLNLTLLADQITRTFSATAGITVSPNGASVQIPANAMLTSSGAPYTGTVSIASSYYSPDTTAGEQVFAQPYIGSNNGAASFLQSVGFIEVKLTDANGAPLQLSSTSAATLTFPASTVSAGTATVPLWYYDEAAATWVREGQASLQANGTYQGNVNHFTIWNADVAYGLNQQATLKACFKDSAGQPALNLYVKVRSAGWSASGFAYNGTLQTPVIAGQPLELISMVNPARFAPVAIAPLAPGEVRELLPCIVVTAPSGTTIETLMTNPPTLFTTTSTVTPGTTTSTTTVASFAGNYLGNYIGSEVGTFNVNINNAGVISGTGRSITYNLTVPVTGTVGANGAVALSTAGTAGSATFSGSISPTGALTGTWIGATGSGTFTGQRQ